MSVELRSPSARDAVIEIRLAGKDVAPGTVRSKDLAEIIESTEDMIASIVVRDDPAVSKDEVIVGLLSIGADSLSLEFATPLRPPVLAASAEIARSIEENDYEGLPEGSIAALANISGFSRRRNCELELYSRDRERKRLAVITPETKVEPIPLISGFTTIYGQVIRVGGVTPKVMVGLPSGQNVYCGIDIEVAKELGQKLYVWVGLRGTGKWSAKDFSLREFRVQDVTPYEDTPISKAVAELSHTVGEYFAEIEDVDSYVAELRSGHLEE